MVYANEEKVDWNNLILSEDYLNLLDEDPQDVRHSVMQVSAIANNTDLPEAARTARSIWRSSPARPAIRVTTTCASCVCQRFI